MTLPAPSAGDFAVALLAFMAAGYEASLRYIRGRGFGHGYAAALALAVAAESVLNGVQYMAGDPALVVALVRGQFVAFLVIAVALVGFARATTGAAPLSALWRGLAGALVAGLCGLVLGTDVIVTREVHVVPLSALDGPYLVPVPTAGTDAYFLLLLAVAAGSVARLALASPRPLERVAYGIALAAWLGTCAADAAITMGLWRNPPMYTLEYGFVLLALSLMAVDVSRYGALLRASERSREQLERDFRALIEGLPLLVLIVREGRVVQLNAAAAAALRRPVPIPGGSFELSAVVHPEDAERVGERLARVGGAGVASGPGAGVVEARLLRTDAAPLVAELTALDTTTSGAPAVALLGLDVTEQRGLMARMMAADRMVAVGTLAAGVAHEINNPMTYVGTHIETALGALGALLAGADGPLPERATALGSEAASSLGVAREGALRVRRIVRDLTMLSRGEAATDALTPVELGPVLESAIHVAQAELRYRARWVLDLGDAPPVRGDAARLGQVFLNLVVNAAQSIPRGAVEANEVRIRVARVQADGAPEVCVSVQDTGAGIPPEHRARVFDPFFTTKPPGQGTGLGLSMCQNIVHAHGGRIDFETIVGVGTTFRVWLPALCEPTDAAAPTPAPARASPAPTAPGSPPAPPPGSDRAMDAEARPLRRRILIVDDEPRVGDALSRFLGRAFDCEAVADPREALRRLRAPEGQGYDAILTDLMMPEMTGIELFEAVRRDAPERAARFVFLTGGALTEQTQAWVGELANPWLEKPPELDKLIEAIERVAGAAQPTGRAAT